MSDTNEFQTIDEIGFLIEDKEDAEYYFQMSKGIAARKAGHISSDEILSKCFRFVQSKKGQKVFVKYEDDYLKLSTE